MSAAGVRLAGLTKELRLKWLQTRESWADTRSREFDSKYMEELFLQSDRTLEVIAQLDKLITKIRKDCE